MEYYTARNTVILALAQVGVITIGVLSAGAAFKVSTVSGLPASSSIEFASDYGWLFLIAPLIWVIYAYRVLQREEASSQARFLAVSSGIVILVVLIITGWNVGFGRIFHLFIG